MYALGCFSTISEWDALTLAPWRAVKLQTVGVAGLSFFAQRLGWLVVFWLISRGIIRKHTVQTQMSQLLAIKR